MHKTLKFSERSSGFVPAVQEMQASIKGALEKPQIRRRHKALTLHQIPNNQCLPNLSTRKVRFCMHGPKVIFYRPY